MLLLIVVIISIALVMAVGMSSMMHQPDDSVNRYEMTQDSTHVAVDERIKNNIDKKFENIKKYKDNLPIVRHEEPKKEVIPQVNNYNFEGLSKVLMALCGVIASVFGIRYMMKFFNYFRTTRKFSINTKKTKKLINSLNNNLDNQKEFLLIADSIERQLKLNDLLLRQDDAKKYGLELDVADDDLYGEYKFINEKLINSLK